MMDIYSSCVGQGKIVFIRYNPDKFSVDGKVIKMDSATRRDKLIECIKAYKPKTDFEILYLNYDTIGSLPAICTEPDFPGEIVHCVHTF